MKRDSKTCKRKKVILKTSSNRIKIKREKETKAGMDGSKIGIRV